MAKVCLLLLSLWGSAHLAGAIQTKTGTIDAPVTMAAKEELQTRLFLAGVELDRLVKNSRETGKVAKIVDFDLWALAGTQVFASLLKEPFHQRLQAYLDYLPEHKEDLDGLVQTEKTVQASLAELTSEQVHSAFFYQVVLAALISTRDLNLIWPLADLCEKQTSLQHAVDMKKIKLDELHFGIDKTKQDIDARAKTVPLALMWSWSPAIFEGLSASGFRLAKFIDQRLHKLLDSESNEIKDYLPIYENLKEELNKAWEREATTQQ